tara:strand:- start:337 stop:765 length:429 start_codon:yes stop_codon:yes gene_type:complete
MTVEETELIGVPYSCIEELWDEVKPMLEKGIAHGDGELDINDILKLLVERSMQLWVVYNSNEEAIAMAGVTEIVNYPKSKICRAVVLGGEGVDMWIAHIEGIEEWAKSMNCDKVEAYGRRGLAKKMEKVGYSNKYVVIRKDI